MQNRSSAVPIEQLNQSFHLVQMTSSVLNICGEVSDKIDSSSTKIFKSVVGGDIVQAWIFSLSKAAQSSSINCNNFPKTPTHLNGFLRRCAFIRFPLKFVIGEDPKRPNERPGDKDLAKKLQTQEALTYILIGF